MWTEITRRHYRREGLRYASDMTDREWDVIAPLMPGRRALGRPRQADLRVVLNAILYVLATGCQWRAMPKDYPPRSTVQGYFYRWRDDGTWQALSAALTQLVRVASGRSPSPTAGIIDSQSVKTTESGGPRGFDNAKKIKGRKRHIVTDTDGSPIALLVLPANVQDNHGAVPLLTATRSIAPNLHHIFADRVYRGPKLLDAVAATGPWTIQIITRSKSIGTFKAEPRRWVVERTFAWLGRARRLAKDFEATIESAQAWLHVASLRILSRRLAKA